MPITVVTPTDKQKTPGFPAFVDALTLAYNLKEISTRVVRWVEIEPLDSATLPPRIRASVARDTPELSVILKPHNSDGPMVSESDTYCSPMLLVDVSRWGRGEHALGDYEVTRWRGRPGNETQFRQKLSLREIIGRDYNEAITSTTPVADVVAFLPLAPNREFDTQFVPLISYDPTGHSCYKVGAVVEDSLCAGQWVSEGCPLPFRDFDENHNTYNWTGESMARLSDFETATKPTNNGHMILIVVPVERPAQRLALPYFNLRDDRYLRDMWRIKEMIRGADLSGVSIGRGLSSGAAKLYQETLANSALGNPVIYHVHYVGVTPSNLKQVTTNTVKAATRRMRQFETLQPA